MDPQAVTDPVKTAVVENSPVIEESVAEKVDLAAEKIKETVAPAKEAVKNTVVVTPPAPVQEKEVSTVKPAKKKKKKKGLFGLFGGKKDKDSASKETSVEAETVSEPVDQ